MTESWGIGERRDMMRLIWEKGKSGSKRGSEGTNRLSIGSYYARLFFFVGFAAWKH